MAIETRGEYPYNWGSIAIITKDEANWNCVRCDHAHDIENGYMLTVHHLDGDKSNCRWWNLAALCQRCHLRMQGRVHMNRVWMFEHSEWFKPYVAGYYAFQFNMRDDQEYVLEHIDDLLQLPNRRHRMKDKAWEIEWAKDDAINSLVEIVTESPLFNMPPCECEYTNNCYTCEALIELKEAFATFLAPTEDTE